MKKTTLSLVLALAMLVSACGCSADSGSEKNKHKSERKTEQKEDRKSHNKAEETTEATTEATTEETTEATTETTTEATTEAVTETAAESSDETAAGSETEVGGVALYNKLTTQGYEVTELDPSDWGVEGFKYAFEATKGADVYIYAELNSADDIDAFKENVPEKDDLTIMRGMGTYSFYTNSDICEDNFRIEVIDSDLASVFYYYGEQPDRDDLQDSYLLTGMCGGTYYDLEEGGIVIMGF